MSTRFSWSHALAFQEMMPLLWEGCVCRMLPKLAFFD